VSGTATQDRLVRARLTASTTLVVTALLLTACGGGPLDGKTGPEVAAAAADALEESGAFHLAGTISRDGREGVVDLQLQGQEAAGTLTLDGMEIELLSVGDAVHVRAAPDFWSSFGIPAEAAAQLEGRWVLVPAEAAAGFQEFTLAGFVAEIRDPDGEIEDEVTSTEIDGEDAVVVSLEDGSTLTVLDDDRSYPVEVTNNEGSSSGTLTISGFGEEEDITAPSDALDLAEVVGGA
jgi:hypothetical protein